MEAGITDRFRFSAIGAEGAPDAVVGRELADLVGLEFEAVTPVPLEPSLFLQRLQIHAFHTAGMVNAWDLQGGTGIPSMTTVCGLFGEVMRTHFSDYPMLETSEDLLDLYLKPGSADAVGILRPEVSERYRQVVIEELIERSDSESGLPFDRLDVFHIRHRQRRWSGTIEEIGHTGRVAPLYSLLALQAGFVLGPARRHNDYLNFHVMRAACPPLAEHRLANRGWSESLLADVPDADRYRAEPCAPTADAPRPWQADRFDQHRALIEAYVLNEPESPLYEVVDRGAAIRALGGELAPGFNTRYQLFGALAAAVWLGHHELAVPTGTPTAALPDARTPPSPPRVDPDAEVERPPEPEPEPEPEPPEDPPSRRRRLARRLPSPVRHGLLAARRLVRQALSRPAA